MNTNRLAWSDVVVWVILLCTICLLVIWTWPLQPIILRRDIDRLSARLDALEEAQKAARPVQVQTMNIHVERPQDAPKVAEGLLRGLPGFAGVKRLVTAKDLRP